MTPSGQGVVSACVVMVGPFGSDAFDRGGDLGGVLVEVGVGEGERGGFAVSLGGLLPVGWQVPERRVGVGGGEVLDEVGEGGENVGSVGGSGEGDGDGLGLVGGQGRGGKCADAVAALVEAVGEVTGERRGGDGGGHFWPPVCCCACFWAASAAAAASCEAWMRCATRASAACCSALGLLTGRLRPRRG